MAVRWGPQAHAVAGSYPPRRVAPYPSRSGVSVAVPTAFLPSVPGRADRSGLPGPGPGTLSMFLIPPRSWVINEFVWFVGSITPFPGHDPSLLRSCPRRYRPKKRGNPALRDSPWWQRKPGLLLHGIPGPLPGSHVPGADRGRADHDDGGAPVLGSLPFRSSSCRGLESLSVASAPFGASGGTTNASGGNAIQVVDFNEAEELMTGSIQAPVRGGTRAEGRGISGGGEGAGALRRALLGHWCG